MQITKSFAFKLTEKNFKNVRNEDRVEFEGGYWEVVGHMPNGDLRLLKKNVEREIIAQKIVQFSDLFKNIK